MVKIDRFNEFNIDQKTLYVFDFDDTLMVTPRYEDIAIKFLNENLTVKDLLDRAVKRLGIDKSNLKVQDKRIFIEDPNKNYKEEKDWVRKGDRLYLVQPDEFCYLDESLPKELKELAKLYKSVKDKCIVTAIVELSNISGFENVIFYDDNSKYIRGAKKIVSEKLPNLNFKCIKVQK